MSEEENRTKQFEISDPNIVVDLKASIKSAEADKQGTHGYELRRVYTGG